MAATHDGARTNLFLLVESHVVVDGEDGQPRFVDGVGLAEMRRNRREPDVLIARRAEFRRLGGLHDLAVEVVGDFFRRKLAAPVRTILSVVRWMGLPVAYMKW